MGETASLMYSVFSGQRADSAITPLTATPHPIALRGTTIDGTSRAGAIGVGTRVTVWYRYVGESRPVAHKIRVLPDSATH